MLSKQEEKEQNWTMVLHLSGLSVPDVFHDARGHHMYLFHARLLTGHNVINNPSCLQTSWPHTLLECPNKSNYNQRRYMCIEKSYTLATHFAYDDCIRMLHGLIMQVYTHTPALSTVCALQRDPLKLSNLQMN